VVLINTVMRIFSWFSPRVAEVVAPALATVLWYASPRKRRVTRLNLRAVFPDLTEQARQEIARGSMVNYIRGVFEAGMLWHWPIEQILACFDPTQGRDCFKEAKAAGRGVIVAAPHCGAWELTNIFLQQEMKGTILYKPGKHDVFEAMLSNKRGRGGGNPVPATSRGLREMYKNLKSGQVVGLLPDQEPTLGDGRFAPFYGFETLTGVLLPRLAKRTGAAVVFASCERRKNGRYCVHLFRAPEDLLSDDMRTALSAVNKGVEQCIEVDRKQYLWAYKRFRHRPEGQKSLYKRG
jgi:KDO2-lipid IV(A) lauroyltransferase